MVHLGMNLNERVSIWQSGPQHRRCSDLRALATETFDHTLKSTLLGGKHPVVVNRIYAVSIRMCPVLLALNENDI